VDEPTGIAVDLATKAEIYVGGVYRGKPSIEVFPYSAQGAPAPERIIQSPAFCSTSLGPDLAISGLMLYATAGTCTGSNNGSVVAEFRAESSGRHVRPIDSMTLYSCCNVYQYIKVGP
jgi:hypothetical protein